MLYSIINTAIEYKKEKNPASALTIKPARSIKEGQGGGNDDGPLYSGTVRFSAKTEVL